MTIDFKSIDQRNQRMKTRLYARILVLTFFAPFAFAQNFASGKIALVQYNADLHFADYEYNMQALTSWADQAVNQKANIIVFPEGSAYGYTGDGVTWCKAKGNGCADVTTVAEEIPQGRSTKYWEKYAYHHQVYVLFNLPEKDGNKLYNTTGIVGPNGYMGKYRKRFLYYLDKLYANPGDKPFVLKTPFGNFGLLICMDLNGNFLDLYKKSGVSAVILQSDWDEAFPEALYDFAGAAFQTKIDLFASDVSDWDGTGKYAPSLGTHNRERNGLPAQAVGIDGVSIHDLQYSH